MNKKEIIWLKALNNIRKQLEEKNCKYFLDTGTLLGAIRDHSFIPWDNDIDLAVVDCDNRHDIIRSICQYMYEAGYNVTATIDEIDIFDNTGLLDLGVKFYHLDDDYYWAVLGKVEGSGVCHSLYMSLSRSIIFKKGYSVYFVKSIISYLLNVISYITPSFVVNFLLRKSAVKSNVIKIPRSLLSDFINYIFYETEFKVPKNKEDYLSWRYGETWMKPNPHYDYTTDDKAINK